MLSIPLPTAFARFFSASSFVGPAAGAGEAVSIPVAAPELVSAYEDPPHDLDQRVRAIGEW